MNRNSSCNRKFQLHLKQFVLLTLILSVFFSCLVLPEGAYAKQTGVTNAKVVLRKAASKESAALQTLPKGEEVTILGTRGSWYKVNYGRFTGYVMKQYVKVSSASSSSVREQIKDIGTPPGAMRIGDETSDVKKLQKALDILGYYDGRIDGIYGEGTAKAVKEYQKKNGLEDDGVAGPDTVKSIFGSCSKTTLSPSLLAEQKGSSSSTSTRKSSSRTTAKAKTVNSISDIGSAPKPMRPGASGSDVVKLQQALECLGYYDGVIDGDYGEGTTKAVKAFQRKRGMKVDGIAGSGTIRVLFGSSGSKSSSGSSSGSKTTSTKYKTEVKDWYADDVSRLIPKNAVFTVKDVYTGRTFKVRRWAGSNHIDAEPLTASDSATMKKVYGGSWSWRRRPILIQYNGHVYAASMNGMPHGDDTISGNNFNGHFCIHFKNSKTHGTKKVDKDHQNAVNIASKYSW
ncbi:MAG: hypothetical protein E7331_00255 [Clostridiales bacterium]|nr:hypothetical protein [Clostridiales bacterium]